MGKKNIKTLVSSFQKSTEAFKMPPTPILFGNDRTNQFERVFTQFITKHEITSVVDEYENSLRELFYLRNPTVTESSPIGIAGENEFIANHLGKNPDLTYCGTWVYYPWTGILSHMLPEAMYHEIRTARNQLLVTKDEQQRFANAVVGIAGLSIGNSVALALAYSGGAHSMKLADPDVFSASNLNRVRVSASYLGVKKVFVAAQQIYEVNPYATLKLYPEGINSDNIEDFLIGSPKLSIVVDEMDDIKLKLFIRLAARAARLPIVMATDNGDNAIVDIDRYDIDPNIKPFDTLPELKLTDISHGIDFGEPLKLKIKEKVMLATKLVGAHNAVPRMQESLLHVGRDLVSWPQLGIAAFMGGAALTYVIKKIALGESIKSGKTHISLDTIFETLTSPSKTEELTRYINTPDLVTHENNHIWEISERDFPKNSTIEDQLKFILHYATMAPSSHNTQPWRFSILNNQITVFGDPSRALPVSDPTKRQFYISLGACLLNIRVALHHFGFHTAVEYIPAGKTHAVAKFECTANAENTRGLDVLFPSIKERFTDKFDYLPKPLPASILKSIASLSHDPNIAIHIITDDKNRSRIADWVADSTRHIMKSQSFRTELSQWMRHNYTRSFDGMPAKTVGIGDIQSIAGPFLMKTVNLTTGNGDRRLVNSSPALIIMTLKKESPEAWIKLGELYEHILLLASSKKIHNATLTALIESPIASRLARIFLRLPGKPQAFFRLGYSKSPVIRSPRIPVSHLLNP